MKKADYIIVGGGMTASAAAKGIREVDQNGVILMISSDTHPPYNRPPLSKALWKGKPVDSIWRETGEEGIELLLDRTVTEIKPSENFVSDNQGQVFQFSKLLLATGGTPRKLPIECEGIIYYRTFENFQNLKHLATEKKRFAVIGSGFIGSEIAAALAMNDKEVFLFDIGPGIGWNIFPEEMVSFLNEYYASNHVQVFPGRSIVEIKKINGGYQIITADGKSLDCDVVVAGIGITPNVDLGISSGLKTENGIQVDDMLRTSNSAIYAAGDVANFFNPLLEKRIRVEHADNANIMGKQAGRNMAGAEEKYDYLPFFYSDLFDLGYEAVGELNFKYHIVEDWQEKYQKGVLYYLNDNRVRGVLLWNVWDKVEEARQVIASPAPVSAGELIKRIV